MKSPRPVREHEFRNLSKVQDKRISRKKAQEAQIRVTDKLELTNSSLPIHGFQLVPFAPLCGDYF
jgi:hypothetical protein